MQLKLIQSCILSLLLLVNLYACGSDSDTPTPPPATASSTSAEGRWVGTIQNANPNATRTISSLVLDDGVYWMLYSVAGTPSILAGFIQGTSDSQNGTFTSSDAKDFNLQAGLLNATINGSYATKQSLNGTTAYQNGIQNTFTMTYDSDYDLTADMNIAAGTYTGFVTATETVTVVVSTTGTISGSSNTGCIFTGSFSPRAHGNVYDVTIIFGNQAGCNNRNETVTGIAFYEASAKRLLSAAWNGTRTDGFVFIGTKP